MLDTPMVCSISGISFNPGPIWRRVKFVDDILSWFCLLKTPFHFSEVKYTCAIASTPRHFNNHISIFCQIFTTRIFEEMGKD
jgi:hypothetical protein